jgi:hypothetical protein
MEEFKRFDSHAQFSMHNARLAKEPQIIKAGDGEMVKLQVVCTSRNDRHSDLWVEVTVRDGNGDLAKFLQKGDNFGFSGFPALRKWGDNNDKISFEVLRAELFCSIDLFGKLKERGWAPGAAKPRATKNPARNAGRLTVAKKPRPIVDLDDDLEG